MRQALLCHIMSCMIPCMMGWDGVGWGGMGGSPEKFLGALEKFWLATSAENFFSRSLVPKGGEEGP